MSKNKINILVPILSMIIFLILAGVGLFLTSSSDVTAIGTISNNFRPYGGIVSLFLFVYATPIYLLLYALLLLFNTLNSKTLAASVELIYNIASMPLYLLCFGFNSLAVQFKKISKQEEKQEMARKLSGAASLVLLAAFKLNHFQLAVIAIAVLSIASWLIALILKSAKR